LNKKTSLLRERGAVPAEERVSGFSVVSAVSAAAVVVLAAIARPGVIVNRFANRAVRQRNRFRRIWLRQVGVERSLVRVGRSFVRVMRSLVRVV
jgi:hypothetical protein